MRTFITLISAALICISAAARNYCFSFRNQPISDAILAISKAHPEISISFIYKELDKYRTSTTIDTDDPYEALRLTVGLNPITITVKDGAYYIEALQRGDFQFRGTVIAPDKEPVAGATVMLLNPADSTVITYGVCDSNGRFSVPCDKRSVLAKISCMGFKTLFRKFDTFNVGTIMLDDKAINLSTVTVEGASTEISSDRTTYLPSMRQKRAAQNATDLLRFMAIPQIKISAVNSGVTDNFGREVKLFINGIAAAEDELEGLSTRDVRRVEYLEFPTDPRFMGVPKAINFIIQEYEYGGYTKASLSEAALVGLSSKANIFSKFSYRKMSYDLFVGSNNLNNRHIGSSISSSYLLESPSGQPLEVNRDETVTSTHYKRTQVPLTFRASYNTDNVQIRNTVGFVHENVPVANIGGEVSLHGAVSPQTAEFTRSNPTKKNSVNYSGTFYFALPKEFTLNITPTFDYAHTDDRFSYFTQNATPIVRNADEKALNFRVNLHALKKFGQKHSIMAGIDGGSWSNRLKYSGSSEYTDRFSLQFGAAILGYNFHSKAVSLSTDFGVAQERSDINGKTLTDTYPWMHLNMQYTLAEKHMFSTFFQYASNSPMISEKASDILRDNEFLYITGNPFVKNSRHITLDLAYTWIPSNAFSLSAYGEYFGNYNRLITTYSPFDNGTAVIRNYVNDGDFNRTHIGLGANLKLFGGKFQLYASPEQYFYRSTGIYNLSYNPFVLKAQAIVYLGQFYIKAYYATPEKQLWDDSGTIYRTRNYHSIEAGWSDNNWNIRLSTANIFNKGWSSENLTTDSRYYSEHRINYSIYYHPRLSISATYTINYGKKIQRGNEVGQQSAPSSAILK